MTMWRNGIAGMVLAGGILAGSLPAARAGEIAAVDAAANYLETGWASGSDRGVGWGGGWTVASSSSSAGGFIANPANNVRLVLGSQAFGLWADNGQLAEAVRAFADPMETGDVFQVRLQNLNVSSTRSQSVGLALRDAAGNAVIQFYYNGGQSYYRVSDAAAGRATTMPWTDQTLEMEIRLLSATRYRLTANALTLEGDYAAAPTQIRFWNWSGWGGGDNDFFFDEPTLVRPRAPGVSVVVPAAPQECDELEIWYDAAGGPLAGASAVTLHAGRNGWRNPQDYSMEPQGDGLWRARYPLRQRSFSLQWAFCGDVSEAGRTWDNNREQDWQVAVAPCASAGRLAIDDPPWNQGASNRTSTVRVSGRAEHLQGELHWRNETTGQEGWIPATTNWSVSGVALDEGTNVFRIVGTTTTNSPNQGARDCATNALYRTDGWQWRQNGGQGWGEWALNTNGEGGHFIGADASTNLSINPYAWGLYSLNGGLSEAIRRLNAPLAVGETIRLKFQNNYVESGGSVGFGLRNGQDERLFSFAFVGGAANYYINDDVANRDTGMPWRRTGFELAFTLTSPTTYCFEADAQTFVGTVNPTADNQIRVLRFWSDAAGAGSGHDAFLADLRVDGVATPSREIAAQRTIVRTPGPEIRADAFATNGHIRVEVPTTDADFEYGLYVAPSLTEGAWSALGAGQRGNAGAIAFDATNVADSLFLVVGAEPVRNWSIQNPYVAVDWEEFEQHKAALHVHTTMSDGGGAPSAAIDRYVEFGYTIVAITDHDTQGPYNDLNHPNRARTTWPWEAFGRVPETLGVLAVEGNEISHLAHHNSYFCDYGNPEIASEAESLEAIAAKGGVAIMNHPGRYTSGEDAIVRDVDWYVQMFRTYPHLVGIEVYNQIDRFPGDRATWDALLTELIDERPVWGLSNDDMHNMDSQLGCNGDVMLVPELTEAWIWRALVDGTFFFFHSSLPNDAAVPTIQAICASEADGTIAIQASDHDRIEWISEGRVVCTGDEICLDDVANLGGYVRAMVYATAGDAVIGTQPFRVVRIEDAKRRGGSNAGGALTPAGGK